MAHMNRRGWLKAATLSTLAPWTAAVRADDPSKPAAPKPDPYSDCVLVAGEPPKPAKDSFTIAVLPDTQHYSEKYPDTYHSQTKWIVEQQQDRRIACVLHLGDITNHNTPAEWQNARKAMRELDGRVPYFFLPGNHDYSEKGACQDRTTLLNEYFPLVHFKSWPTFGGVYDKEPERMENSYHLFSAGGRDFLVLALEFGPRGDVLRWANEILSRHSRREAILITHALIYYDDTRYDWKKYGVKQKWNPHAYPVAVATKDDVADGEELWNNLIAKHENVILTLNGHVLGDGLGRVTTTTPGGRAVPQLLVNYQFRPHGGDGWLRLMEFHGDGQTVDVADYSPTRRQRNDAPQSRFSVGVAPVKQV